MRLLALALTVLGLVAGTATAADKPKQTLARYCSPTGDVCYGIFRQQGNGRIVFQITTQERYFASYRLCVKPPSGAKKCRNLPINRQTPVWGSNVYWRRNFGNQGPGVYRVTWSQSGVRLGPVLKFTRR